MESKTIHPASTVGGIFEVPGDKSISHRAVILSALSEGQVTVENFLMAEDCLCTVQAFRQMGIPIEQEGHRLQIQGQGLEGLRRPAQSINCGNSGTTARLLMGVLTGQPFEVELWGDASLSGRPMDRVMEPLSRMGAFFQSVGPSSDRLPIRMRGSHSVLPLYWKSPVASAQVKSAILLAGLYASGTTEVEEPSLSRDHTERMLQACGVFIRKAGTRIQLQGTAILRIQRFQVPGDLSSAAFLLAAGILRGSNGVQVKKVGVNPTRTGFLDILLAMGAACRLENATEQAGEPVADIHVKASSLKAVSIEGELIPRLIDEIPILTVLATQAKGRTVISNAQELRLEESDRLAALCAELSKMGARISETSDGLIIDGPTVLKGSVVQSHNDHRLAMSLAIAGLAAEGVTTIEKVDCIATSFPTFWELLQKMHFAAKES